MSQIRLVARNGEAVRQALERGEALDLDTASEESTDEFLLFANTQAGARFANKTRQAMAFEQMKTRRTHVIVYAGSSFEIFETLSFVHVILALSLPVQARVRQWVEDHLPHLAKRE